MTGIGDNQTGDEQKLRHTAKPRREAWEGTLEELDALAEERRADGWDVVDVAAIHTDPVTPDMGDDEERFGIVYTIADNHSDAVRGSFEDGSFTEYQVYGRIVSGYIFQVVELLDPERTRALLIASSYERTRARGLSEAARTHEVLYTHAKTIDGTPLGVVKHEAYEPLLPEGKND
ncbi:DUF7529 family protein [Halobacteriaceae archaeon SHR40]|uniref:DUF7529 family protein n=1 Tax=Halovenus amylolytica TaxID=2500550 RepID=UPI000FE42BBC